MPATTRLALSCSEPVDRRKAVGKYEQMKVRMVMNELGWAVVLPAVLLFASQEAVAEIYACEGDDGVMSYQDQPCPEPAAPANDPKPEPESDMGPSSPPQLLETPVPDRPVDPELVAACKKRYRDEIDRLDAELAGGVAADKLQDYREEARALSQRLSRCEHDGTHTTGADGRSQPDGRDL